MFWFRLLQDQVSSTSSMPLRAPPARKRKRWFRRSQRNNYHMTERTHVPWRPCLLNIGADRWYKDLLKDPCTCNVGRRWCLRILTNVTWVSFWCYATLPVPRQSPASCLVFFWKVLEVWPRFSHWLLCWMLTRLLLQTWIQTFQNCQTFQAGVSPKIVCRVIS